MNNGNSIFTNVYSVILKRHTYPLPILKAYLNRCIKEGKLIYRQDGEWVLEQLCNWQD